MAVTGDDEDNLVVSLLSKQEFGVPRVIARINNPDNEWLFNETWGVDVAVSAPHLLTALVEEAMSVGTLVRLLSFAGDQARLSEVDSPTTHPPPASRSRTWASPATRPWWRCSAGTVVVVPGATPSSRWVTRSSSSSPTRARQAVHAHAHQRRLTHLRSTSLAFRSGQDGGSGAGRGRRRCSRSPPPGRPVADDARLAGLEVLVHLEEVADLGQQVVRDVVEVLNVVPVGVARRARTGS